MPIDPISLGLAGLNFGLGMFQSSANNAAQRQAYLNQAALQDAQFEFSQWQAGLNQRTSNLNNRYGYWQKQIEHNQQLAYTHSLRNFELVKAINQAETVQEARIGAGVSYVLDADAISQMSAEAAMQDAVALKQYNWRALEGAASVSAGNMEGRSVDRLINSYAQQAGDYATLMEISGKLRDRQYTRQQQARVGQYLNEYRSQDYYMEQDYFDPIAPFPSLPTLMLPAGPTSRGAAPMNTTLLDTGSAALGAVNTYFDSARAINALKQGGK